MGAMKKGVKARGGQEAEKGWWTAWFREWMGQPF